MSQDVDKALIFESLTRVLREVFDNDEIVATADLSAKSVGGWDSLKNVLLFVEIERAFGVRFSAAEISGLRNIGDLVALLEEKTRHPD